MFDLNNIAVFIKVVEVGSFTGAAQVLGIPKTTVSRQVAQLEANLGVTLLMRTTRKLHLTEAGEIYFERCRQILGDIKATSDAIASLQSVPQGTLRITVPIIFGRHFLAEWVIDFIQRYDQIKVEVFLTNKYVDLGAERIDVAFRFDPPKQNSLIQQLKTIYYWVCASSDYLSKYGEPQTPQALTQHRCIVLGSSLGTKKWRFVNSTATENVAISSCLKLNDLMLAQQAAVAGVGIVYLPYTLVAEAIASGRLIRILTQWTSRERNLCMVCPSVSVAPPKARHLSPKVQAFLNFITEKSPHLQRL